MHLTVHGLYWHGFIEINDIFTQTPPTCQSFSACAAGGVWCPLDHPGHCFEACVWDQGSREHCPDADARSVLSSTDFWEKQSVCNYVRL